MNPLTPLTDSERREYAEGLDRLIGGAHELAELLGEPAAVEMLTNTIREANPAKMATTLAFALLRLAGGGRSVSAGPRAEAVLVAHQRHRGGCLCGWSELGKSHAGHQVAMLREAGLLCDAPNAAAEVPNTDEGARDA